MTEDQRYKGRIGRTFADSKPWWPVLPKPRDGAPNVVVILFDDTGFSHFGCYGSTIDTPSIDRLAAGGLRYTNFHTTALCSPTRAALLTGRNHHSVGMRGLANWNTGFPNCTGGVGELDNTVTMVMSDNGASQEGGAIGVIDTFKYFNGIPETIQESLARIDDIGGPKSNTNYPWGWAQVGNTPGKRYKQNTHGGGIRDPLIALAPARSFEPNGFGLYNMVGNCWECADWFDAAWPVRAVRAAAGRTLADPTGPAQGGERVMRGGSYLCHPSYCWPYRNAARAAAAPVSTTGHIGFRCVSDGS